MVRASQHPVIPAFPPRRRKSLCYYYSGTESDEDLVENTPSVEPPQQEECQVSEVGPSPKEEEEAEVAPPQEAHIIRQTWMRQLMTLNYHLHDRQDHLLLPMQAPLIPMVEKKRGVGQLNHL